MAERIAKTRLQAERLKRQWTQEEIATKIHVQVKTYSRWERGTQVAALVMQRRLSKLFQQEVDHSWFLPLGTPEEISTLLWHVPYDRNPYFVDHDQRIEHLHALITANREKTPHGVISGLGGIGKTQLALEYAHRYRDYYHIVLWARAGTQAQLFEDFASIAHLLQLSGAKKHVEKQLYLVNQVLHWLQTHHEWLLILDNVEEDHLDGKDFSIVRLLSTTKGGHILLTTRAQSIANLAQNLMLDGLSPEEGAQFLLHRSHYLSLSDSWQMVEAVQRERALELSYLLDGLPLALEQAAAYIQETGCGLAEYRQVYKVSRKDVLDTKVTYKRLYTDYGESVATTWLISFRRVAQQSTIASDLLKLLAYLAPDSIPTHMILKGAEKLDAHLHRVANDAHLFNSACQVLLKYSLIKRFANGATLSIHRLIQAVLQDTMESETQQFWAEQAMRMVERSFETLSAEEIKPYLPHARNCAILIKKFALRGKEVAHLLVITAKALYKEGWHAQARSLFNRAYDAMENLPSEEDSHDLSLLLDIARVHMDLGVVRWAAKIYDHVKGELEQRLGPSHPEVIMCLNNLATAQMHEGKIQEAAEICDGLFSHYAQESGFDLLLQATTCSIAAQIIVALVEFPNNLKDTAIEISDNLKNAELYYKLALDMRRQVLGLNHLEVARSATELGIFYLIHYKNYEKAEPLLREALKMRQKALGDDHPEVAESLVSFALLCWDQQNLDEAERFYLQALTVRRQKLGPYHPGVFQILYDLAALAADQHKDKEAERYFQEMLSIIPHAGGTKSPDYLLLLAAYSHFLQERGRQEEAAPYEAQMMRLFKMIITRGPLYLLHLSQADGDGKEASTGPWFLF